MRTRKRFRGARLKLPLKVPSHSHRRYCHLSPPLNPRIRLRSLLSLFLERQNVALQKDLSCRRILAFQLLSSHQFIDPGTRNAEYPLDIAHAENPWEVHHKKPNVLKNHNIA